jgi:hypothetical protein
VIDSHLSRGRPHGARNGARMRACLEVIPGQKSRSGKCGTTQCCSPWHVCLPFSDFLAVSKGARPGPSIHLILRSLVAQKSLYQTRWFGTARLTGLSTTGYVSKYVVCYASALIGMLQVECPFTQTRRISAGAGRSEPVISRLLPASEKPVLRPSGLLESAPSIGSGVSSSRLHWSKVKAKEQSWQQR